MKKPMWLNMKEGELEEAPAAQLPDIAVAFNTGMGLSGNKVNWSPTIKLLAEEGVPTLCTSFLKRESEEDEELLNLSRCNIVIPRHKNPWRSELLAKMVFMRKHYFTYNGCIQGFRGLRERDEELELVERAEAPVVTKELLSLMLDAMLKFRGL